MPEVDVELYEPLPVAGEIEGQALFTLQITDHIPGVGVIVDLLAEGELADFSGRLHGVVELVDGHLKSLVRHPAGAHAVAEPDAMTRLLDVVPGEQEVRAVPGDRVLNAVVPEDIPARELEQERGLQVSRVLPDDRDDIAHVAVGEILGDNLRLEAVGAPPLRGTAEQGQEEEPGGFLALELVLAERLGEEFVGEAAGRDLGDHLRRPGAVLDLPDDMQQAVLELALARERLSRVAHERFASGRIAADLEVQINHIARFQNDLWFLSHLFPPIPRRGMI